MHSLQSRSSLLVLAAVLFVATPQAKARDASSAVAVAPQYGTTHVYVATDEVDAFAKSFLATFGGKSTPQAVATVTPTPSSTSTQLLQTPAGTVSLFGFKTPIPYPFGAERNGYLVTDMDKAVRTARAAGADVIVSDFPDPIGRDAVVQWPGGVTMQIYWHTNVPDYAAFETVPENRIYVSPDRAAAFEKAFLAFSHGHVVSDERNAPGVEIGKPGETFRRIRIESKFGRMSVAVTDGQLPWPYGRETTGYEVADLAATLDKATKADAKVIVPSYDSKGRQAALVEFPGGYIAEIHQLAKR